MTQIQMEDLRGQLAGKNPDIKIRVTGYLEIFRMSYNKDIPVQIWKSGRDKNLDMVISLRKGLINHSLKIKMTGKIKDIIAMLDEFKEMET